MGTVHIVKQGWLFWDGGSIWGWPYGSNDTI